MQKFKYKTTEIYEPGTGMSKERIDAHCQTIAAEGWELKASLYQTPCSFYFIWQKPAFPEAKRHAKGFFGPTDQQP